MKKLYLYQNNILTKFLLSFVKLFTKRKIEKQFLQEKYLTRCADWSEIGIREKWGGETWGFPPPQPPLTISSIFEIWTWKFFWAYSYIFADLAILNFWSWSTSPNLQALEHKKVPKIEKMLLSRYPSGYFWKCIIFIRKLFDECLNIIIEQNKIFFEKKLTNFKKFWFWQILV